jgi:hypothetical protein
MILYKRNKTNGLIYYGITKSTYRNYTIISNGIVGRTIEAKIVKGSYDKLYGEILRIALKDGYKDIIGIRAAAMREGKEVALPEYIGDPLTMLNIDTSGIISWLQTYLPRNGNDTIQKKSE